MALKITSDPVKSISESFWKKRASRVEQQARRFDGASGNNHQIGGLRLPAVLGVKILDRFRAAFGVEGNAGNDAVRAQLAVPGCERRPDHGILRSVLGVTFAGETAAPATAHATGASVVRNGVPQHRDVERMPPQPLGGGFQNLRLLRIRQRRHGQGAAARRFERVGCDIAGDADLDFRLFVKRFEVGVGDRPIIECAPCRYAIEGFHLEVLGHVPPGHGAISNRPAAYARGVVVVSAIRRPNDLLPALRVHEHARFLVFVRTDSLDPGPWCAGCAGRLSVPGLAWPSGRARAKPRPSRLPPVPWPPPRRRHPSRPPPR